MPSSNALIGTGILLEVGDGLTPETFTAVAEIVSLKPPGLSRNEIEVSVHNAGIESKLLGMLRVGQVTMTVNWIPLDATQSASAGLMAKLLANEWANFQIPVPPAGLPVLSFRGAVQNFDPAEVAVDAQMTASITLTVDLSTLETIEEAS